MRQMLNLFIADRSGVTAIEYALIAASIAIVIVVAGTAVGNNLDEIFEQVSAGLAG